jgi:hypothetical protein
MRDASLHAVNGAEMIELLVLSRSFNADQDRGVFATDEHCATSHPHLPR